MQAKTLSHPPCHYLILAAILLALCAPLANAADTPADTRGASDEKTKKTVAMSQPIYKKLQATNELVEAKQYAEAHGLLEQMIERKKLSIYEKAQIWNLTAYTYYLQEKYKQSISAYEKVLVQGEIPEALAQSTLKTLSQLYFTIDQYGKALETVQKLIALIENPSPDIYMLEGQAYFQLKRYQEAEKPIKTAIAQNQAQGKEPKENWLLLLRVIYYELKDYQKLLETMKQLTLLYPKNEYLLMMAGIYSELGDTGKQLMLTEPLHEKGYLTGASHTVNLANLYLLHEMPYKAAKLLQKEIDAKNVEATEQNLRLLSQAWYQAREDKKSIPPLKRAATLSNKGELYIRLAQAHINLEEWDAAVDALQKGIKKGDLKRTDTADMMLGIALFNQKKLQSARTAFEQASKDKRSNKAARQWLSYIENELARKKVLEQKLPPSSPAKDRFPQTPTALEG